MMRTTGLKFNHEQTQARSVRETLDLMIDVADSEISFGKIEALRELAVEAAEIAK